MIGHEEVDVAAAVAAGMENNGYLSLFDPYNNFIIPIFTIELLCSL
jgi:hypothetical protein